mmetsp:Transcript_7420/g.18743  ORF Transcript_7420/g.18743 Transcript_7420/m.18743 type:complete len:218 (+) Transcript_7420:285-938(+)
MADTSTSRREVAVSAVNTVPALPSRADSQLTVAVQHLETAKWQAQRTLELEACAVGQVDAEGAPWLEAQTLDLEVNLGRRNHGVVREHPLHQRILREGAREAGQQARRPPLDDVRNGATGLVDLLADARELQERATCARYAEDVRCICVQERPPATDAPRRLSIRAESGEVQQLGSDGLAVLLAGSEPSVDAEGGREQVSDQSFPLRLSLVSELPLL